MPKAKPTQDSTKDFTPKVEISTPRDVPKDTKKRVRIEVRCDVCREWNRGSYHEDIKAMIRKNSFDFVDALDQGDLVCPASKTHYMLLTLYP